jgi:hypothetical protein
MRTLASAILSVELPVNSINAPATPAGATALSTATPSATGRLHANVPFKIRIPT